MDKEHKRWLNDIKQAFVYIWTNKETGRQYIGSHVNYQIDDGYIASSSNNEFWADYNSGLLEREIVFRGCMRSVRFFERDLLSARRSEWGNSLYNLSGYCGKDFHCARRYYVYNHIEVIYVYKVTEFQKEYNVTKLSKQANYGYPVRLEGKPPGKDTFLVKYEEDVDDPNTLIEDFKHHLREIEPKVIKKHIIDRRNKLWETLLDYKESLDEGYHKHHITKTGSGSNYNQYNRMKGK